MAEGIESKKEKITVAKLHDFVREKFDNLDITNNKISEDINSMREQIINNLVKANKVLQNKVDKLEKQLKNQESYAEANNQYHRRNNIEIHGIPNTVMDDQLENKVVEVLSKIDVQVESADIEACHRLPSRNSNHPKKTVVRFVNRKKNRKIFKRKKKACESQL